MMVDDTYRTKERVLMWRDASPGILNMDTSDLGPDVSQNPTTNIKWITHKQQIAVITVVNGTPSGDLLSELII